MKDISELSRDEQEYICEQIPLNEVRKYFRANPKDFNKIKPGYRAEMISNEDIIYILNKQLKTPFIATFIKKKIDIWINTVNNYMKNLKDQGYSEDGAIIKAMTNCVFKNNPQLYFKLIDRTVSEEYINLLEDAVYIAEKIEKENNKYIVQANEKLKDTEIKLDKVKKELENYQNEVIKLNNQTEKLKNKIDEKNKHIEKIEKEKNKYIEQGNEKLKDTEIKLDKVKKESENYQNEVIKLKKQIEELTNEIKEKNNEKVKTDPVYDEDKKENENEIINKLSSLLPMLSNTSNNKLRKIAVLKSKMDSEEKGDIDNLEDFEDGVEDNLNVIGYDDKISREIAQIISFSICNHNPIIIGENATAIGQCLSATMNGENLSEIFISVEVVEIDELFNILDSIEERVILIHGIFDGYNVTLYNAMVSYLKNNKDDLLILLSIEGISANMLPVGVFQHAFYINGDEGLTKIGDTLMQSFNILNEFIMAEVKYRDFRDKRKEFTLFSDLLGNKQVNTYTLYLLKYGENLNENDVILKQIITVARILGKEESLNEIFHQNGINKGEELIKKFI